MPRLSTEERNRAVGMLAAGISAHRVAAAFNCSHTTIINLDHRLQATGRVEYRPRPGRARCTTAREDRQLVLTHLRNRFLSAAESARQMGISDWTVRLRLQTTGLRRLYPLLEK